MAGMSQIQKLGPASRYPTQLAGTQVLEPSLLLPRVCYQEVVLVSGAGAELETQAPPLLG